MDTIALKHQLDARFNALEHQGLIDGQFRACHALKKDVGHFFFVDLVAAFLNDFRTGLKEMTTILNQSTVDYHILDEHCIKLHGSAGCIGARGLRKSCANLRRIIETKSKDGCILALNNIKLEYHNLRSQVKAIMQLERDLVAREALNL